jgi:hypothetical protein
VRPRSHPAADHRSADPEHLLRRRRAGRDTGDAGPSGEFRRLCGRLDDVGGLPGYDRRRTAVRPGFQQACRALQLDDHPPARQLPAGAAWHRLRHRDPSQQRRHLYHRHDFEPVVSRLGRERVRRPADGGATPIAQFGAGADQVPLPGRLAATSPRRAGDRQPGAEVIVAGETTRTT